MTIILNSQTVLICIVYINIISVCLFVCVCVCCCSNSTQLASVTPRDQSALNVMYVAVSVPVGLM